MSNPQESVEKSVQFITHVPVSLRQRYKVMAALKGVKMSTLQLQALEDFIAQAEEEQEKLRQVAAIAQQG